ncbi:MAG TPA: hypothetical protein VGN26_10645 [Armatimonadota bacterium]
MPEIALEEVEWPQFGMPVEIPKIGRAEYESRISETLERMAAVGLTHLLVYGDREHFANLCYLTGYDPRFEEALLILSLEDAPMLLVGNEGSGYVGISPLDLDVRLYQPFSLLGQPRSASPPLRRLLGSRGIGPTSRVGVAGWKYFTAQESEEPALWLETPAYLADTLRELTGARERVINATGIFMNPLDGLRLFNSVDQVAFLEYAATRTSEGVKRVLWNLSPGQREYELARHYHCDGLPLCCHTMLSAGSRARMGLASPGDRRIKLGEPMTTALGLNGSLTARAGFVARDENDLDHEQRGYLRNFAGTYFGVVAQWYRTLALEVAAGLMYEAVMAMVPKQTWEPALNPGHYIHLDEWVSTPFYDGSSITLKSGMALQVDIIPVSKGPYWLANTEDGVVLADETLRSEIRRRFPEMWQRFQARRSFMQRVLGLDLAPEILPLSNTPALFPPFLLSPEKVLVVKR